MYRYFSDETGNLVAKCKFKTTCFAAQTDVYVDDQRNLDLGKWRMDLPDQTLVAIETE
jgi:hypothetical protein